MRIGASANALTLLAAYQGVSPFCTTREAIGDTKLLVVKRTALNALAGHNVSIAQQLFALTVCLFGLI